MSSHYNTFTGCTDKRGKHCLKKKKSILNQRSISKRSHNVRVVVIVVVVAVGVCVCVLGVMGGIDTLIFSTRW